MRDCARPLYVLCPDRQKDAPGDRGRQLVKKASQSSAEGGIKSNLFSARLVTVQKIPLYYSPMPSVRITKRTSQGVAVLEPEKEV